MTKPLASRIALVTGASRGIGYATARALAKAGAHVVAVARTQGGLEELDDEIRKDGGTATLVRSWANETVSTKLRVNLFSPGPIRTRMRASVFPGEDPMTLDTPEQAAEFIVPMCAPQWNETGKLYDYKTRTLMSFRAPE